ncbi:DUF2878 domain-containing protein [Microbulbifer mangrovi]|uniref:DUF2878 domain-containing protein n=1 Tax=Microbulbifer mangrovi TaxID=927787 RepID=UPI0009905B75|nr:DUF2878 domain-containing protein [Microbulbifer mangrovi]
MDSVASVQSRSRNFGKLLLSGLLFELVWFLCVVSPGTALLTIVTLCNLLFHLWFFDLTGPGAGGIRGALRTLVWVAVVTVSGCVMDSLLFRFGLFETSSQIVLLPVWLSLLWVNFALALRFAFHFLQRKFWVAALFGAIGGPASYLVGAKINASVSLAEPLGLSLAILAGLWTVYLPVVMQCAKAPVFRR